MLFLILCIFISIVKAIDLNDDCIELNNENIVYNQKEQSLTIQGTGKLCDCLQNEFIN